MLMIITFMIFIVIELPRHAYHGRPTQHRDAFLPTWLDWLLHFPYLAFAGLGLLSIVGLKS